MEKVIKMSGNYASETLDTLPIGNINKQVTGCGLTSLALENNEDVVISMPKVSLIHNKASQYPNDRCDFRLLPVMGGVTVQDVNEYVQWCRHKGQPIKILTTYDSTYKLAHLLDECKLVVDESQLVTTTLRNKGRRDNILKLIELIKENKDRVSLISATPIDPKYTKWAAELPQIKLDWSNITTMSPVEVKVGNPNIYLKRRVIKNIEEQGYYYFQGEKVKKLIVFINSVRQIGKLIREMNLNPKECSIICGDSVENRLKLTKNGKIMDIKNYEVGDKFKYLFVTSSGFEGVDIYDNEALSVIISYTHTDYTYLDMTTDLIQAASRNRDKTNKFYGTFLFVYNQSFLDVKEDVLKKKIVELESSLKEYVEYTNEILRTNEKYKYNRVLEENNLVNEYVFIDPETKEHFFLEDVMESTKHNIFEVRKQYKEGFKISDIMRVKNTIEVGKFDKEVAYSDVAEYFQKHNKNGKIDWKFYENYPEWIKLVEETYRLDKRVVKSITEAKQIVDANGDEFKNLIITVRKEFKPGRYPNGEIRDKLSKLYKKVGLNRKGLPKDLYEFFPATKINNYRTNQERGIEILR